MIWWAISILAFIGLFYCLVALGYQIYLELGRIENNRERIKIQRQCAIDFRGIPYWREEMIVRKLLKNQKIHLG